MIEMKQKLNEVTKASEKMTLWGLKISPYTRKIMIALEEKGLTYTLNETLPVSLLKATGQSVPHDFQQASPLGKIPALQYGEFTIADSAAIAAYLDKQFDSHHPLYPVTAEEHAKAIWFEHYADHIMTEVIYRKIFVETVVKPNVLSVPANTDLVDAAIRDELPPILEYIDAALSKKQWISGNNFTMGDIAVFCQFAALQMSGYDIASTQYKNIEKFYNKCLERPSIIKCLSL